MTIERAMNCGGLFIYRVIVCLQVPDKQQQVGFCSDPNLNTVATLGGIKDSSASSQNSLELDCLARFAVDEHNKKETTLMQACQYGHWEVVLILVFFKANVVCMELVYLTDLILKFAGIEDVFTSSRGSTKTLGNFVKATFDCLLKTYGFLTPDFWTETCFTKSPYQEHTDLLAKPVSKITFTEDPVIEA
ncbi:hypothetical protein POM88_020364 [Heracleum sosnowskyi]|uniref:Small ribosomal subunit protein uS5 C-terminal domain-containing protein n=1 Tax=Heracleum sosnowskyi TaxID=360622 RepID=A0AAD8IBF1_9APIA|nr:hypothetical protein POM88_020364 [Heracleum sosnowskyi]